MKSLLFVFFPFCLISSASIAQTRVIEATENKNVFLFFPCPIEKALTGSSNFSFGYDKENGEKYGVLTAVKGQESTLHLVTTDGTVYFFILKYSTAIEKDNCNHFFTTSDALTVLKEKHALKPKETLKVSTGVSSIEAQKKIKDKNYYSTEKENPDKEKNTTALFCTDLLDRTHFFKKFSRENSGVKLRLSNIAYKNDKTYIVLSLENNSTVDYDINFIQFNKTAKKVSKKATYQSIEIDPVYIENGFKRIKALTSSKAVYVFTKLLIDKHKVIRVELNEKRGERNINLPITSTYINNPNN